MESNTRVKTESFLKIYQRIDLTQYFHVRISINYFNNNKRYSLTYKKEYVNQ